MVSAVPRVSVLMAVYNMPAQYLRSAIDSILEQSFSDFEFIIVDDGSDSPTRTQLQEFAARDDRIRLHSLNQNVGLTRALNVGLRITRGVFVARQDADDISMPDRLAATIVFLEEHPGIAAAGTFTQLIGPAGERLGANLIEPDLRQLLKRNVLVHGSMMFRKETLDCIGGYNEKIRLSQDYEVYLRMVRLHGMRLGVVPKPLYALRQHTASLSSRRMFRQFYYSVMAKTLTLPDSGSWRRRLAFMKIFAVDLLITHRLLMGSMLRNALSAIRFGNKEITK